MCQNATDEVIIGEEELRESLTDVQRVGVGEQLDKKVFDQCWREAVHLSLIKPRPRGGVRNALIVVWEGNGLGHASGFGQGVVSYTCSCHHCGVWGHPAVDLLLPCLLGLVAIAHRLGDKSGPKCGVLEVKIEDIVIHVMRVLVETKKVHNLLCAALQYLIQRHAVNCASWEITRSGARLVEVFKL